MKRFILLVFSLALFFACDNRQRLAEYEAKIQATEINVPLDSMKCLIPEKNIDLSGCNNSANIAK